MARYLVRTDKGEGRTGIFRLGNPVEYVATVYTDFLLKPGLRNIMREEIVDPATKRPIGQVRLFRKDDLISIRLGNKEIAALNGQGEYREKGEEVPVRKIPRESLSSSKYERLISAGLTYAYKLGEDSDLSHLFCLERNDNLASIVYSRNGEEEGTNAALMGLVLSLAQRLEDQEYIFDFIKK